MGATDGNIMATIITPHNTMYSAALETENGWPMVMLIVSMPIPMSPA